MRLALWSAFMFVRFFWYAFPRRLLAYRGLRCMGFAFWQQIRAHFDMDMDFARVMAGLRPRLFPDANYRPPGIFWLLGLGRTR